MSEAAGRIRIQTQSRVCPYCKDGVADETERCVCNGCLAVVHRECWDETGRCPSCGAEDRLVAESRGPRGEATLSLAPRAASAPKVAARTCIYSEIRKSPGFQALLTLDAQAELRTAALRERIQREMMRGAAPLLGVVGLIFALLLLLASPWIGVAALAGLCGWAFATFSWAQARALEAVNAMDWSPIPARVESLGRPEDGRQPVVLALDPETRELPGSYIEIAMEAGQRLIGLDIPQRLAYGLKVGDYLVLASDAQTALYVERVGMR